MWETVKLKDICSEFTDGDWIETKDQSAAGIRLIQTGNVKIGFFADRKDKARYISQETFRKLNCTEVLEGDILVSRLPAPVGRSCLVPRLQEKAITSVDCTVIRTNHRVLSDYLNYYMQSPWYFSLVQEKVTGATRQRISRKNLGEVLVSLPPLAEQQRIVAKLDAAFAEIDRAIETTTRSLTESIRLVHSSLELCIAKGGGETAPITLGDKTFLEIIDGDRGANYPKKSDFYAEGYCVFLNTKNVLQNGFNFDTCQFISDERDALLRKGKLQRHDVVLTTRGTLGNVGYYSESVPYENIRINSGMLILRAKTHKLLPSFLFELLRSNSIKLQIEQQQKGAAQQHIPVKTLSKFAVEIPTSVEAQSRVVQEIKTVQSEAIELKEAYAKKLTQLSALKQAILAQELQPPESHAA